MSTHHCHSEWQPALFTTKIRHPEDHGHVHTSLARGELCPGVAQGTPERRPPILTPAATHPRTHRPPTPTPRALIDGGVEIAWDCQSDQQESVSFCGKCAVTRGPGTKHNSIVGATAGTRQRRRLLRCSNNRRNNGPSASRDPVATPPDPPSPCPPLPPPPSHRLHPCSLRSCFIWSLASSAGAGPRLLLAGVTLASS